MRIYYLSGSHLPSRDANSIHVMKMCAALASIGHEVTLFGRGDGSEALNSIYEFYGTPATFGLELFSAPNIRLVGGVWLAIMYGRRIRQLGVPDLVYGRHVYGLSVAQALGVPFVLESHHIHSKALVRRLTTRLTRQPQFRRLVVISDALAQDYAELVPGLADKITVAHDAADRPPRCIKQSPSQGDRADEVEIGYVGHLYPGKGMEVILEIAPDFPHRNFHIVGGREKDIAYWKSQSPAANITFHGFVAPAQLANFMEKFDIALAPLQSRIALAGGVGNIARWTSPLKIFEYMAYGKSIVASDLPVLREVLRDEENALLVPPKDISAWKDAINRLVDNPRLRDDLARNAEQDFLQKHNWEARARAVLDGLS